MSVGMKPKLWLVVCGSRRFGDLELVIETLDRLTEPFDVVEVIHGAANGADTLADVWARRRGLPRRRFHPDWDKHGKGAGPIRNQEMLDHVKEFDNARLVAFWDGESRGTADMITRARKTGMKVKVVSV